MDGAAIISAEEATALFGETAVFSAEQSGDIPGLEGMGVSCIWETVDDPDDLDDLTSHLLQVQVYQGAQFYAPDLVAPDAEHLENIGDDAYVTGEIDTAFIDGELVAFLSYMVIDLGDEAPDASTKRDQVIDLLRLVHDRLT